MGSHRRGEGGGAGCEMAGEWQPEFRVSGEELSRGRVSSLADGEKENGGVEEPLA